MNGKRTRGRPGRNKPSNSRNQTFDSNGPEGRVRGSASQVFEKYQALARDAQTVGDRVAAENYFQHAEHYYRIFNVNAPNPQNAQNRAQGNGSGQGGAGPGLPGPVAPAGPAAAKPQAPRSEVRTEAAKIGAEEAPGGKPERSPEPASPSDDSPDETSAKAAES